jgi:glycyl-tRNA synthetase
MINNIFNVNGLIFWDEHEIQLRESFISSFSFKLKENLLKQNGAWKFHRIESPLLTPKELINNNYTNEDIFIQESKLDWYIQED